MFTFNPTTMAMSLSKGDTASFDITATGDVTFTSEDRAVFTVKDKKGAVVKETVERSTVTKPSGFISSMLIPRI